MGRHTITSPDEKLRVTCGWDNAAESFFAQVYDLTRTEQLSETDTDDLGHPIVEYLGLAPHSEVNFQCFLLRINKFIPVSDELIRVLHGESTNSRTPTEMQKMVTVAFGSMLEPCDADHCNAVNVRAFYSKSYVETRFERSPVPYNLDDEDFVLVYDYPICIESSLGYILRDGPDQAIEKATASWAEEMYDALNKFEEVRHFDRELLDADGQEAAGHMTMSVGDVVEITHPDGRSWVYWCGSIGFREAQWASSRLQS